MFQLIYDFLPVIGASIVLFFTFLLSHIIYCQEKGKKFSIFPSILFLFLFFSVCFYAYHQNHRLDISNGLPFKEEKENAFDTVADLETYDFRQEDVPESDYPDFKFVWQTTPESTMCSEIGYDSIYEVLAIRFRNTGNLYFYYYVPFDVWENFSSADSKGAFFHSSIKPYYDYSLVE